MQNLPSEMADWGEGAKRPTTPPTGEASRSEYPLQKLPKKKEATKGGVLARGGRKKFFNRGWCNLAQGSPWEEPKEKAPLVRGGKTLAGPGGERGGKSQIRSETRPPFRPTFPPTGGERKKDDVRQWGEKKGGLGRKSRKNHHVYSTPRQAGEREGKKRKGCLTTFKVTGKSMYEQESWQLKGEVGRLQPLGRKNNNNAWGRGRDVIDRPEKKRRTGEKEGGVYFASGFRGDRQVSTKGNFKARRPWIWEKQKQGKEVHACSQRNRVEKKAGRSAGG